MSRPRDLAIGACILTTITVGLLAAAEVGSYLVPRLRHSVMMEAAAKSQAAREAYRGAAWATTFWREYALANRLEYEPYVEWRPAPFAGKTIVVNGRHNRRTFYSRCGGTEYSIWMFGGSTIWGVGVPDRETIPSFVAKAYTDSGRAVCVRNYGQLAWASTQEVIGLLLELRRARRSPDLVVFYDGINDVVATYDNGSPGAPMYFPSMKRRFEIGDAPDPRPFGYLSQMHTIQLLRRVFAPRIARQGDAALNRQARATIVAYEQNVEIVRRLSQAYGFKYAFFWQPVLAAEHKPLTRDERSILDSASRGRAEFLSLFERTYAFARAERRPRFFYIADVFNDQNQALYVDFAHLGPAGNRLVAARMYALLRRAGEDSSGVK